MKLRQKVGLQRIVIILFWMIVEVAIMWNVGNYSNATQGEYFLKLVILAAGILALIELSVKLKQHFKYIKAGRVYVKNI